MKASLYNWIVEADGHTVIFNGATGCMAEIEERLVDSICSIVAASPGSAVDTSCLEPTICKNLVDGGFLLADEIDEKEFLRQVLLVPRYSMDISYICVVATTRCNFACPYCIQKTEPGEDLRSEVEEKILEMIENTRARHLSLTFYGGEPLLLSEACCRVSSSARGICERREIAFHSLLVTNGYLLDKGTARSLKEAGIERAQVTIDGNREFHDLRRVLKNGQRTFERIVRNVIEASEYLPIDIRMNLDSKLHRTPQAIEDVEQAFQSSKNVHLHVSPTRWKDDPDSTTENMISTCRCFAERHLYRTRLEAGIPGCCAVSLGSRVVLPNGDYVLCWDEVGSPHPDYGSILNSPAPSTSLKSMWMRWDPYIKEPCGSCRYLPTCKGSCPRDWLEEGVPFCEFGSDEDYFLFIRTNRRLRVEKGRQ